MHPQYQIQCRETTFKARKYRWNRGLNKPYEHRYVLNQALRRTWDDIKILISTPDQQIHNINITSSSHRNVV